MTIPKHLLSIALLLFVSSSIALSGVVTGADLSVTKNAPAEAMPGTDITYTIEVINGGPDQAGNATMTDNLPAGVTFVSFTQDSGPTWSCNTPNPGAGGAVSCTNTALNAGTDSTFTLVVHLDPGTPAGTAISNTATVSDPTDPNEENNSSTATTFTPTTSADLAVTKSADAQRALPNSNVTYTIQVTNNGPDDALNAELDDTLPGDMTFVSLQPDPNWSCTTPNAGSGGTISCTN